MTRVRLAVLADYAEEGWPSMDLVAEELVGTIGRVAPIDAVLVRPSFQRSFSRIPLIGRRRVAFNGERLVNRFRRYPEHVHGILGQFDAFHVADHSYAHLVHALPPGRTGVYCHDLDAFASVLVPARERRPFWFRALARRTLAGLEDASLVFHSTRAVGEELCALALRGRIVHAPYGVSREYLVEGSPAGAPPDVAGPYVLHVGSSIPRKRLDVLLSVFARLRAAMPGLRLVQIGGTWTPEHERIIAALDLARSLVQRRGLARHELAALYRGARLVLLTSDSEGFGIPVIEALACGAPVLASDLPTTREAGGAIATYAPPGDVEAFVAHALALLGTPPDRAAAMAHGRRFTWEEHARRIGEAYLALIEGARA